MARLAPETGVSVQIENARLKENVAVPVTFFVRFVDARGALRSGNVEATLELYSESERLAIEVAGRRVPLEYETTSALAYSLESSELWAFGPQGLVVRHREPDEGHITFRLQGAEERHQAGLISPGLRFGNCVRRTRG